MNRIMALHRSFIFLVFASLMGCAQLGIPKPETFAQQVAVGYAAVAQVRQTATTLLVAEKISSADAINVQISADLARSGLDIARTLAATNPNAADAKLTAARQTLAALAAYLATKGK